jgi:hypothetical protein
MGIGGHILGEKKLRRLREISGLDLDRAYIRNKDAEGRVIMDGKCIHYKIDPDSGQSIQIDAGIHWTSCPKEA